MHTDKKFNLLIMSDLAFFSLFQMEKKKSKNMKEKGLSSKALTVMRPWG